MISAPKYDEISVKNLYPIFIKLPNMVDYFPDQYSKGRQCDHSYMFNITNTLHPDIVKVIRNTAAEEKLPLSIVADEALYAGLKALGRID